MIFLRALCGHVEVSANENDDCLRNLLLCMCRGYLYLPLTFILAEQPVMWEPITNDNGSREGVNHWLKVGCLCRQRGFYSCSVLC